VWWIRVNERKRKERFSRDTKRRKIHDARVLDFNVAPASAVAAQFRAAPVAALASPRLAFS